MSKAPPGGAFRPPGLPQGISREEYEESISAEEAALSKQKRPKPPSVDDMINNINIEIEQTLAAIQNYRTNRDNKELRITQQIEALHELYTQLQLIPEEGMSIDFRNRITDMKVSIFEHIQNALELVDVQSIQDLPDAVKPYYYSEVKNKYTREQLKVFVKASDLLFIYGQQELESFKDLPQKKQAEIQGFVTGFIDKFAVDNIQPDEKNSFRTEMLTFNTLCCDLLALIIGSKIKVPDPAQQEQTLMCELLAETCIIVITRVRPIGDSVVMIGEAMAMNPIDFAKKGVMGAVALGTTSVSFPTLTSFAEGAGHAIGGLGSAAADFSIQNPLFAYGTLYHLFNYINEKLEIRQLHNNPDFVFRRLLTNLRGRIDSHAFDSAFGEAPLNPVVGSFEFAGLLSKSARYVAETFCGQVRGAVQMVKATAELPQSTLKVCKGIVDKGTSAVHLLANRMTAKAGLAGDQMFSNCHSVMEDLLKTEKYKILKGNQSVIEFVRRLGLFDKQRKLTEEKVKRHEAIDVMTSGFVLESLSETQRAEGSLSPDRFDPIDVMSQADYQYEGPQGDYWGSSDPGSANSAPLGAGAEVLRDKELAAKAANAKNKKDGKKGGMKTKRHKAAVSKKKKSNKNKRQSRRKFRRSFSRKGRK